MNRREAASWLNNTAKTLSAVTVIVTFAVTAWAVIAGPVGAYFEREQEWRDNLAQQIKGLQDGQEAANERLDLLRADVSVLQLPASVFQVSGQGSRPVDGYCLEGQPCTFALLMRRTPGAEACDVMTDRDHLPRHFVVQLGIESSERREVIRLDERTVQNLTSEWTPISITLQMPSDFGVTASLSEAPGAALVLERAYEHCLGDADPAIVERASTPLPFHMLAEPPPAQPGAVVIEGP
jgi:hypothetical protein